MNDDFYNRLACACVDLQINRSDCEFQDGDLGETIVVRDGEGKTLYKVVPSDPNQNSLVLDRDDNVIVKSHLWSDIVRWKMEDKFEPTLEEFLDGQDQLREEAAIDLCLESTSPENTVVEE